MIKKKTVFILGAGASQPFGYPTGIQLREIICKTSPIYGLAKVLSNEADDIQDYEKTIGEFRDAFLKSSRYSIDEFLEHRQEYMLIGKMAIAQALIPFEKEYRLFEIQDNWYMYLYSRLNTSFEEFDKNNVSFITLNYDRSLEHFLFVSLKNSYTNKTTAECAQKISSIAIIHLYGQLDLLPWQGPGGYSYNNTKNLRDRLKKANKNIQLIHEEKEVKENKSFKAAYDLIDEAEQIYFLGFGYSETNLNRIRVPLMKDRTIFGTAFNLEYVKRTYVDNYFRRLCGGQRIHLGADNDNALTFLQQHLHFE